MRFSKNALLDHIWNRICYLEKEYDIDPGNGYAQCQGRDIAFTVAYGEYDGLLRLHEDIETGEVTP